MNIDAIAELEAGFWMKLEEAKARAARPDFAWYPYYSLGSFSELQRTLTGERRLLLDLIGGEPVLDLGCGDGDIAFLMESLGCRVHAVDYPLTNYNRMQGIRALAAELHSTVTIHEMNLDDRFTLPPGPFGAAFLFGLLYHLKNPFYLLETLSRHARHLFLSTRIARFSPDRTLDMQRAPVAYLVGPWETNNDPTNFWIFSEEGLKRILERANWSLCDFTTSGSVANSDPVTSEGDERAYCVARSRAFFSTTAKLLEGWYNVERGGWRWTARRFSLLYQRPPGGEAARLKLDFLLPEPLLERLHSVTLSASVNGQRLRKATFTEVGEHQYAADIPSDLLASGTARVDFELDKALAPGAVEARELGIIVCAVDLV